MNDKTMLCPMFAYSSKYAENKYSRDINYYHNIHHVYSMLMLAYKDREYINSIIDIDCFLTAIMFHDTIYKTGDINNEKLSAEYAAKSIKKALRKNNVSFKFLKNSENIIIDQSKIDLVCDLILSTKMNSEIVTEAEKLLHDYDYMSFANLQDMKLADKQIINEAMRDGYDFHNTYFGRRSFYIELSKKDIFLSEKYKHLNEVAHKNIISMIGY